jgi:hypothetical protein
MMLQAENQVQRGVVVLTAQQRHLVRELEEICREFRLDFYDIKQYEPEARTTLLELAKNHIVRGEVVRSYTLIDEPRFLFKSKEISPRATESP